MSCQIHISLIGKSSAKVPENWLPDICALVKRQCRDIGKLCKSVEIADMSVKCAAVQIIDTIFEGSGTLKVQWVRRALQYTAGLFIMALGIVLIKKVQLGVSPLSAVPAAVSELTALSLGTATMLFHALCVISQMALMKRITLKTVLILPLAAAFGHIIDIFMAIINPGNMHLWSRGILCICGVVLSALGIVMIVGTELMLPAPDALVRQISAQLDRPLSAVKIAGDVLWVCITLCIELAFSRHIRSVGAGTVISMLLTGEFVGIFKKLMPFFDVMSVTCGPDEKSENMK